MELMIIESWLSKWHYSGKSVKNWKETTPAHQLNVVLFIFYVTK